MNNEILDKLQHLKLTSYYSKWIDSNKIVGATLEITAGCNLRCVHCYMSNHKDCNKQLSFEQIKQVLDILCANGVLFLTFSGGEPFYRKDFKEIYLYAKEKGFLIEIYTNGILINEEWIKIFKDYPPLLIDLSIYGTSNETYERVTGVKYSFDKFIHVLELLHNADIRFSIKAPLLSVNYTELFKMREICEKYSKESFRFSYDIVPDRNNNLEPYKFSLNPLEAVLLEIDEGSNVLALSELKSQKNNWMESRQKTGFVPVYFCSIGELSIHIDYLGYVSPCIECMDKISIFDTDFNRIIKSFQCYKKLNSDINYKCSNCEALAYCSSCPQIRKRIHGDEQIITAYDCIVAKLKYKYYVDNLSVDQLKEYYYKYIKEVKSNEVSKT